MTILPTKTLLTIDDNEDILRLIKISLELTAGWTVFTAESGHDGLKQAQTKPLDAILLDAQMPRLTGMETLHHLRQHRLTQEIPVVFLTATPSLLGSFHATDLGVRGIVAKPFEPETLASQLVDVFGWHHSRKGDRGARFHHDSP